MTRFRFHRGGLSESMSTCVNLSSETQLQNHLRAHGYQGTITVTPYAPADPRIGWPSTYLVSVNGSPVGFSDGPL